MKAVAESGILGLVHVIATNLGGDGGSESSLVIVIKSGGNNMG
jgi:hypothetical protein